MGDSDLARGRTSMATVSVDDLGSDTDGGTQGEGTRPYFACDLVNIAKAEIDDVKIPRDQFSCSYLGQGGICDVKQWEGRLM